jgi:hypothetical protein
LLAVVGVSAAVTVWAAGAGPNELLEVSVKSSGPAPLVSRRVVYSDGTLEFRPANNKVRKKRVPPAHLAQLRADVTSERFLALLRQLAAEDYPRRYPDHAGVTLEVPGVAAFLPSEQLTEELRRTLHRVDDEFAKAFGPYYDWPAIDPAPLTPQQKMSTGRPTAR